MHLKGAGDLAREPADLLDPFQISRLHVFIRLTLDLSHHLADLHKFGHQMKLGLIFFQYFVAATDQIAKEQGISRQGVHDLIRRCNKILEEYEAKLHLVAKFVKIRDMAREVEQLADECARTRDMALIEQIHGLAGKITGTL